MIRRSIRAALRAIETLRGEAKAAVLERLAGLGLEPSDAGFVSLLGGSGQGIVVLKKSDLQILFVLPRGT